MFGFWSAVYTVRLMNKQWESRQGSDSTDGAHNRFREQLVSPRQNPIQVDVIMPQRLVRAVAIEVDLNAIEPYPMKDVVRYFENGECESYASRVECLQQINFSLWAQPQPESPTIIHEYEFDRLVFVRRRRATLRENWRYLQLCRAKYSDVGLPVGMSLQDIRQAIAVSHGVDLPNWRGFWREAIPRIRKNGAANLLHWLSAKRKKPQVKS